MISRVLLLAALALLSGCSTMRSLGIGATTPSEVEELLPRAEARLAAGDHANALADLRKVREAEHLTSEEKSRVDVLLERCAEARIEELSAPGSDPEELDKLFELNLPRQIAITAGVRAARLWLDQDEPVDAYEMIQKVDRRYPPAGTHHERQLAGDVLFEAGMKLAKSKFSILGLFSDRDDAQGILEYLVQNYPQERRCDQAYRQLARLYEHDRLWTTAIERHQDLVTYHLDSPLAVESEWRIPHLRLQSLGRAD
jgi:tetratricopeptide (TPR) repeat protein